MLLEEQLYKVNLYYDDLCSEVNTLFNILAGLMTVELSKNIQSYTPQFDHTGFYGFKIFIGGWQEMSFESMNEIEERISNDTKINKECIIADMNGTIDDDTVIVTITLNKEVMLVDNLFNK